jgi:hypothetical protein
MDVESDACLRGNSVRLSLQWESAWILGLQSSMQAANSISEYNQTKLLRADSAKPDRCAPVEIAALPQ